VASADIEGNIEDEVEDKLEHRNEDFVGDEIVVVRARRSEDDMRNPSPSNA
jgi:hypothetical protein